MNEQESSAPDLKRYWGIIFKRRYLAMAVALVVISAATWGSLFWPETYEASSTVFIQRSTMMDPLLKGIGVTSNVEEQLRTLRDSITTRDILERVIRRLSPENATIGPDAMGGLVAGLQAKITVTTNAPRGGGGRGGSATDLFTISYQGRSPEHVRDVVNILVDEYIAQNSERRRSEASGAYGFIQDQLAESKAKLDDSDRAIREFREKHPNMIPQSETAVMGRMESFQTARLETDIKIKELLRKRDNLKRQMASEPQARLNALNSQLANLTTRFTDSHPEVQKVKIEIEELKRQIARAKEVPLEGIGSDAASTNPIYQQTREELMRTDSEIEALRGRYAELGRQLHDTRGVMGGMSKENEEWSKLQRDRTAHQKIYDDLLQKLESARVSKDLQFTDEVTKFKIMDPAVLPAGPVKPDRLKIMLIGIILGLAAGAGAALGLDLIDRSFKDEESIERQLGIPVLAVIPKIVTPVETTAAAALDRKVMIAASVYLAIILLVFARELLAKFLGIRLFV